MNMLFAEEPSTTSVPRKTYTSPPSTDEDEDDETPTPPRGGKVKPRIWQYGGKSTKYKVDESLLYADDYETQRIGLNNPNYNTAVFNMKGINTFRGLDNHQPVMVTDGSKYKVLYGPQDTAKFNGKVYEKRLKF
jgi:hypothetical protein